MISLIDYCGVRGRHRFVGWVGCGRGCGVWVLAAVHTRDNAEGQTTEHKHQGRCWHRGVCLVEMRGVGLVGSVGGLWKCGNEG
jgi:hypothetical protein